MNVLKVLTDVTRTATTLWDHMLVAVTTAIVLIQMDLLAMVLILIYCPKLSLSSLPRLHAWNCIHVVLIH